MSYTLISFVGKGRRLSGKESEGYEKTTYEFPDGKRCETNLFLKALLETKYRDISKIILVGTVTSSWDMLLEDEQTSDLFKQIEAHLSKHFNMPVELLEDEQELREKVFEAREAKTMTDDLFKQLESHLSEHFKMPVVIKYHSDSISDKTAEQIFAVYNSIAPELQNKNVLLDITHSFRSMPILLYQALQYSLTSSGIVKNVELVYGEFISKEKPSQVRDLSQYWKFSQVSNAVSIFNEKFDGFKLADLISDVWPEGAEAIKKMSETVQTNFALQIGEAVRDIKDALAKYPKNAPSYLDKVKKTLEQLLPLLDGNSQAKMLYKYSRLLYEKNLNAQAVITLQVAVETAVAEDYGKDAVGNYEWWQSTGRNRLQGSFKKGHQKLEDRLENLRECRNQIAHGGAKNRNGDFPNTENIPEVYKEGRKGFEALFNKIAKM